MRSNSTRATRAPVAYYAMPYFRTVDGRARLNIVTYKGLNREPRRIIRLEYLWDEVR